MSRRRRGNRERAPERTESSRLRRPKGTLVGFPGLLAAALLACGVLARADQVYISYANTANTIEEFTSTGVSGTNTDDGPFAATDVSTPNGIAFDSQGNLYVANSTAGTISEFAASGTYIGVFASGLSSPAGLVFDQFGNLYVANNGDGTITEITPSGSPSQYASGLNGPNGLAFGPNGNLYVADGSDDSIMEITSNGPVIFASANQIGNGPAGVGFTALNQPKGLAFDASGNLYVSNFEADNIEEFAPDGTPTTFATNTGDVSDPDNQEGLWNPFGVAFDSSGDLFVANYGHTGEEGAGYSYIDEFSATGTMLDAFTDANDPPDLRDASYIAIVVPEPSSVGLTMLGAVSIAGVAWRRR